ncbi:MAG: TenA family transcriptional regulator [Methylophilaceae bacterium]|jgi:pyrroloquinoline quinone (PQQ) biosynthesis protein C|uniref:TenA family transcriptional regulator n=1 Tax=Methylobacillus sp. MM3 TaxID=1848039 RepID=UPI0007DF74B9|nr:iron-containing redox enzyme family protein [Methylobacillus sp. MM3]OAJ69980.1 long-chain fatty acid--CoA ligase [Methylobacillus sp. MM3]
MFYDELLAATERERNELLNLPLIRAGAAGQVNRDMYIAFLAEAYHHVKHTVPMLMSCGARLPERYEWLREAVAEYVVEEIGHQEWILNDIKACGADAEAVRNGSPGMATEIMVAYAYDAIARVNPIAFFGMVLVLEGTSVEVATRAGEAIRNSLGLGSEAFTYLTSHGSLDVGHTDFYARLINRIDDPADREVLIHAARVFYKLYGDIFRELAARFFPAIAEKAAA